VAARPPTQRMHAACCTTRAHTLYDAAAPLLASPSAVKISELSRPGATWILFPCAYACACVRVCMCVCVCVCVSFGLIGRAQAGDVSVRWLDWLHSGERRSAGWLGQ